MAADRLARLALEKRTGFPLGAGAPQTTWLAMGMQEGPLAPGWYNRYSLTLMERAELDPDTAFVLNRQDIAQRLSEFAAAPAYALSFYHQKMVSQWAETTFEALLVNRVMPIESPFPVLVNSLQEAADWVKQNAQPGDLVITLGCGDIYKASKMMVEKDQ